MKQARKNNFRRNFGDLKGMLALTRGNRLQYLWAIISVGVASLMGYATPLIVRVTVDSVIDAQPFDLPGWLVAVSYTHLDVYKRQPLESATANCRYLKTLAGI